MLNTWVYNTVLCVERLDKTSSQASGDGFVNLITFTEGRSGEIAGESTFRRAVTSAHQRSWSCLYFKSQEETFSERCKRQEAVKLSNQATAPNRQCKVKRVKE